MFYSPSCSLLFFVPFFNPSSNPIFLNKISDFFIFEIFKSSSSCFSVNLKLNVFEIFSQVSGMNGDNKIVKSLIAFAIW